MGNEVTENKNNNKLKLPLYYKYNSKFKRLQDNKGYIKTMGNYYSNKSK